MARNVPLPVPPREELVDLYFNKGMKYSDLVKHYNVSPPTLSKWFSGYGINPKKKYEIIELGGKQFKRCFGPLHPAAGELLPISRFHKNPGKRGGVQARCAQCQGVKPRVSFYRYKPWVRSIYSRLGYMETVRRLEINERTMTIWLGKDHERGFPKTIHRDKAAKIVEVMLELRNSGEVRHRKSIRRGAAMRGEKERQVKSSKDLLLRHGDSDAEYLRRYRLQKSDAA